MKSFSLVLVAGGVSRRMGRDKLLIELAGATVAERSLSAFFGIQKITRRIVVSSDETLRSSVREAAARAGEEVLFAPGGAERFESVKNGLRLVDTEYVLVHDAARPFVSRELIEKVISETERAGSGIPVLPMTDSVRIGRDGKLIKDADRNEFFRVQTPQGFLTQELIEAYEKSGGNTDESGVFLAAGKNPRFVEGEESNRKLTRAEDVFGFGAAVGIGYDVHRLEKGKPLTIGGIVVPSDRGEVAHSDGDVLLHAVMDAILSAIGERDIGHLFPDNDPVYRGISSVILLREVMRRARNQGFVVTGISAVVALEHPKLSDYIPKIVESIKRETGAVWVNLSATTTEGLGIVGEGLGIAAYAIVGGL